MTPDYTYTVRDSDRSAFGLGWEYRRRERPLIDNPFPPESQRAQWFEEGWREFKHSKLRGAK